MRIGRSGSFGSPKYMGSSLLERRGVPDLHAGGPGNVGPQRHPGRAGVVSRTSSTMQRFQPYVGDRALDVAVQFAAQ